MRERTVERTQAGRAKSAAIRGDAEGYSMTRGRSDRGDRELPALCPSVLGLAWCGGVDEVVGISCWSLVVAVGGVTLLPARGPSHVLPFRSPPTRRRQSHLHHV